MRNIVQQCSLILYDARIMRDAQGMCPSGWMGSSVHTDSWQNHSRKCDHACPQQIDETHSARGVLGGYSWNQGNLRMRSLIFHQKFLCTSIGL